MLCSPETINFYRRKRKPLCRVYRPNFVNLNRELELRSRGDDEWELKMDPPVNKVLPVSRRRLRDLRELLGI